MADTLSTLTRVFRQVFEDSDLTVDRTTTASDIPEWDSLTHVSLILSVEREFKVRFSSSEVAMLQSVGELEDLIDARRRGR